MALPNPTGQGHGAAATALFTYRKTPMKRAVALGCRSAAAATTVGPAAAVQRATPQSSAVGAAPTTFPFPAFPPPPEVSAMLGLRTPYTRRGRGGAGSLSHVQSVAFTWGRTTGRADLQAVCRPLVALPSSVSSPAIAYGHTATSATAPTTAGPSSLLQRRALYYQRQHPHLSQWSVRYLTTHGHSAAGNTGGPRPAAPAEPTQAPEYQQEHQQQHQQQHQHQQSKSDGTTDARSSTRKLGGNGWGLGGSPGADGKWGLLGALGRFAIVSTKKLVRLTGRFIIAIFRYIYQFIRNPRIVEKWYAKAKEATIHTWRWCSTGFRLFFANVRVSYQLLKKKILGYPLRYNEHKLLVQTTADALKLIPFSLLIIIPLGELLIPVALRLFPNMLPSTFQQKPIDHAYLSRKLQAKQELAAFFQELLQERTKQLIEQTPAADSAAKAKALKSFQAKLLKPSASGEPPLPGLKEILEFSRLFKGDFVLNKMDLQTLQVMCKLLGLQPYSVRSHVVLQLRHHINHIQREDREFLWEGVESLTHEELVEACRDRGMKFYGTTDEAMREQMRRWLEVSSHRDVPPILLLWSRCVSMIPAAHLRAPVAAPAPPGAAEQKPAEPSISLAAVADSRAAEKLAQEQKEEEQEATAQAAAGPATEVEPEADALRKTASLEAMTRQVEMLREEEESLRHSISLLQEERAQHKQMQKMQVHPKDDAVADQAAPLSQQPHEEAKSEEPPAAAISSRVSAETAQRAAQAGTDDEAAGGAEAIKEGREGRDVERELRLLRQLTDIQHEHEERQFHVFNQVQMAVEALKKKLAPPSREQGGAAAGEELKPDPNEELRLRAAELLHNELHELDLCMALLAQEFAEDAKEVEHFMTDARDPTDDEKAEAVESGDDTEGTPTRVKTGSDDISNADSSSK